MTKVFIWQMIQVTFSLSTAELKNIWLSYLFVIQNIWGIQLDLKDIKYKIQNTSDSVRIPFSQSGNQMASINQKVISWLMMTVKENVLE